MIKLKLEDFEIYRKELTGYAKSLTKNSINYKDIVQDTYLRYHNYCENHGYELEEGKNLKYLLFLNLKWAYKDTKNIKNKLSQSQYYEKIKDFTWFTLAENKAPIGDYNEGEDRFALERVDATIEAIKAPKHKKIMQMVIFGYDSKEIIKAFPKLKRQEIGQAKEKFNYIYKNNLMDSKLIFDQYYDRKTVLVKDKLNPGKIYIASIAYHGKGVEAIIKINGEDVQISNIRDYPLTLMKKDGKEKEV